MGKPAYPKWKSLKYSKDVNDYLWWIVWKLRGITTQMNIDAYGHDKLVELRQHILKDLYDADRVAMFDQRLRALEEEVRQLKAR